MGSPFRNQNANGGLAIDRFRWYAEEARRIDGRIVEPKRESRPLSIAEAQSVSEDSRLAASAAAASVKRFGEMTGGAGGGNERGPY